jgi:hypothetical protein
MQQRPAHAEITGFSDNASEDEEESNAARAIVGRDEAVVACLQGQLGLFLYA